MTKLQMFVRYTDGSGKVERVERDDPAGRRAIDKAALAEMARSSVRYVEVEPVDRCAGYGGGTR